MKKAVCLLTVLFLFCSLSFALLACDSATVIMSFNVGDAAPIQSIEAKAGSKITPPSDPEHENLVFEGWYLNPEFTGKSVKIPNKMPKRSVTYYAHFIPAVSAVYEVLPDESGNFDARVDESVLAIQNLLAVNNYKNTNVSKSLNEDNKTMITVEIYLKEIAEVQSAKSLLTMIGRAATLEFKGENDAAAENLLTGREHLKSAYVIDDDGNSLIGLKFNDVGTEVFARITGEYLNNKIYIFINGELYTQVNINSQITNGVAVITNAVGYESSEALEFATRLQAGVFGVDLRLVRITNITK